MFPRAAALTGRKAEVCEVMIRRAGKGEVLGDRQEKGYRAETDHEGPGKDYGDGQETGGGAAKVLQ